MTAYTAADHLTAPAAGGTTYLRDPSWVTNSRTVQFGGAGSQVNLHDVGSASAAHWFDDNDYAELPDGPAATARSARRAPTSRCCAATATARPDLVPRHRRRADRESRRARRRPRLRDRPAGRDRRADMVARRHVPRLAGAQPADRAERDLGQAPGRRLRRAAPCAWSCAARAWKGARAGRITLVAKRGKRIVARGSAKVGARGTATVTLRFTRAAKRSLRCARSIKLKISGAGTTLAVTLKR